MNIWEYIFNWFENLITDSSGFAKVLSFSIDLNGFQLNVFSLLTISGLLVYLTIAIIKWAVS